MDCLTKKRNVQYHVTVDYYFLLQVNSLLNGISLKCSSYKNFKIILNNVIAGRKYGKTAITVELITEEGEQPNRKRIKLNTNDKLSEVTSSISYLSTTEQK